MIRTQVYLSETIYNDIKRKAAAAGKPAAEFVRYFIEIGMEVDNTKKTDTSVFDWEDMAKEMNITGGPKDLSRNIDDYLYGDYGDDRSD